MHGLDTPTPRPLSFYYFKATFISLFVISILPFCFDNKAYVIFREAGVAFHYSYHLQLPSFNATQTPLVQISPFASSKTQHIVSTSFIPGTTFGRSPSTHPLTSTTLNPSPPPTNATTYFPSLSPSTTLNPSLRPTTSPSHISATQYPSLAPTILVTTTTAVPPLQKEVSKEKFKSEATILWSRGHGLYADCCGTGVNIVSNKQPQPDWTKEIEDNQIVWIRIKLLKRFVEGHLPHLGNRQIVLLTGDDDYEPVAGGNYKGMNRELAQKILQSENVIHWYAQNYCPTRISDVDDPGKLDCALLPEDDISLPNLKMSPLPIGIDFHTLIREPMWGEPQQSLKYQISSLRILRSSLPKTSERRLALYINFIRIDWLSTYWQRRSAMRILQETFKDEKNMLVMLNEKMLHKSESESAMSRHELWERQGQFAFVLSPRGNGLDCHRTWEALALGNIPIVKSSSIDSLFKGLPVVIVKSWKEVTPSNLHKWFEEFAPLAELSLDDVPQLTHQYWIDQIRQKYFAETETRKIQLDPS